MDIYSIADDLFTIFLIILATILVIDGTRSFFENGKNKKSFYAIIFGSSIILGLSVFSYFSAHFVDNIVSIVKNQDMSFDMPADWGENIPPEQREKSSKDFAAFNFIQNGKISNYFTTDGEKRAYCPAEDDITSREENILKECRIDLAIELGYENTLYWLAYLFIAFLTGWLASQKEYKKYFIEQ